MGSKSEEEITEIKDRSPVQDGLDPISNLDANKQRVYIGLMQSWAVSWELLTLKTMCEAVGTISQVQTTTWERGKEGKCHLWV